MSSHTDVARRFAERGKPLHGNRVFADETTIYSYGHHFPMAIALDDQRTFVLNGDRYSNTTTGHQSGVRGACSQTDWTMIVLPFSALAAVGIMRGSQFRDFYSGARLPENFRVLDTVSDRNEWKCDECGIGWTAGYGDGHYGHEGHGYRHLLGGSLFRVNGKHYLSGFDETAVRQWLAGYFLVELPGKPKTYADAIESLKPRQVKQALAAGVDVKRQGDIFAIPTDKATRQLKGPSGRMAQLLGQNHVATEVRVNGKTYARGTIYHKPAGWNRRPEHVRVTLGNTWHVMVRNTARASFAASGYVD